MSISLVLRVINGTSGRGSLSWIIYIRIRGRKNRGEPALRRVFKPILWDPVIEGGLHWVAYPFGGVGVWSIRLCEGKVLIVSWRLSVWNIGVPGRVIEGCIKKPRVLRTLVPSSTPIKIPLLNHRHNYQKTCWERRDGGVVSLILPGVFPFIGVVVVQVVFRETSRRVAEGYPIV